MPVYMASKTIAELMDLCLDHFQPCLLWLTKQADDHDLCQSFKVSKMTPDLSLYIMSAFLTLLRDRSFGYTFCPNKFLNKIPPQTIVNALILIIKNENSQHSSQIVLTALQILDGMTCLDLIKEFKDMSDKKSPYFKEACKHFNFYAQTLRTLS